MEPDCQGVYNRRAFPCPAVRDWDISGLINACSDCDRYYMYCCQHNEDQACHHFPVFFIDGACSQNGKPNAKAGVGIVFGKDEDQRFSIAITDDVDNFPLRSNQRAELLAAYLGLLKLKDVIELRIEHLSLEDLVSDHSNPSSPSLCPIVATDSEYVVKGVTEWLPKWKVCFKSRDMCGSSLSNRRASEITSKLQKEFHQQTWICFLKLKRK